MYPVVSDCSKFYLFLQEPMKQNETPLAELNFEGSKYKTLITKKFQSRKAYIPDDPNKINAQIPGTILKIMVKEGQQINPSKCLFILEAMKMKNRVFASVSGTIKKIYITEGQIVTKNQLLLKLGKPELKPIPEPDQTNQEATKERKTRRFGKRNRAKSDQ